MSLKPKELLKELIRFDTSNPPGNERECIMFLKKYLDEEGFKSVVLAKDPNRPNYIGKDKR